MVRFSKLPFRHVVRSWGSDIVFTPMIMANSFVNSSKARDVEFTTNAYDRYVRPPCDVQRTNMILHTRSRPLVVQFAAHTDKEFGDAAELVASSADGIDLNCGY
jgi:tRNA-dihydrouridine synthase 4